MARKNDDEALTPEQEEELRKAMERLKFRVREDSLEEIRKRTKKEDADDNDD